MSHAARVGDVSSLFGMLLLLSGCCGSPSSIWDAHSPAVTAEALPAVVGVLSSSGGVCSGTVVKRLDGELPTLYILTAQHCIDSGAPRVAIPVSTGGFAAVQARVVAHGASGTLLRLDSSRIGWNEDWAILAVSSKATLAVMPVFRGDPRVDVALGSPVVVHAYVDVAYPVDPACTVPGCRARLKPTAHTHSYAWSGVPENVAQEGHSGSPVTLGGELIAVLVAGWSNSWSCRLLTGKRCTMGLEFVSIATIRREALRQGLSLD